MGHLIFHCDKKQRALRNEEKFELSNNFSQAAGWKFGKVKILFLLEYRYVLHDGLTGNFHYELS